MEDVENWLARAAKAGGDAASAAALLRAVLEGLVQRCATVTAAAVDLVRGLVEDPAAPSLLKPLGAVSVTVLGVVGSTTLS